MVESTVRRGGVEQIPLFTANDEALGVERD
jgi:hypothetical protein